MFNSPPQIRTQLPTEKQKVDFTRNNVSQLQEDIKYKTRPVSQFLNDEQSGLMNLQDAFFLETTAGAFADRLLYENEKLPPADPSFNPFEDITGYEDFAHAFVGSYNQAMNNRIKDRIDRKRIRQERRTPSFLSSLGAQAFEPINYMPIFWIKGAGFFYNSLKAGAQVGLLELPNQAIRRALDPTVTPSEMYQSAGYAALFSGVLVGALSKFRGRFGEEATVKNFGTKNTDKWFARYFKKQDEAEGKMNLNNMVFNFDPRNLESGIVYAKSKTDRNFYNQNKKTNVTSGQVQAKILNNSQDPDKRFESFSNIYTDAQIRNKLNNPPKDKLPFDITSVAKVAEYNEKSKVVLFDELVARAQFAKKLHIDQFKELNLPIPEFFKSVDDWFHFNVTRAIAEKVYVPKKKGETNAQHQRRATQWTVDYIKRPANAYSVTDYDGVLKTLEKLSPLRRGLETVVKSKTLSDEMKTKLTRDLYGTTGNGATRLHLNKMGIASPQSVQINMLNIHFANYMKASNRVQNAYNKFYGVDPTTNNFQQRFSGAAIDVRRAKDRALNYIRGQREKSKVHMSKDEFFELVGEARIDANRMETMTMEQKEAVKEAITAVDEFFSVYLKEASNLGMFANQNTTGAIIERLRPVLDDVTQYLDDPNIKKTKAQIKRAEKLKIRLAKDIESHTQDIRILPNDTSILEDYLPLMPRRDKILANPLKFKAILRNTFEKLTPKNQLDQKYINIKTKIIRRGLHKEYRILTPQELASKKISQSFKTAYLSQERELLVRAQVEMEYGRMLHEVSAFNDIDNINQMDKTYTGRGKIGTRHLLERSPIDPKDIIDFIETDVNHLMKMYQKKMGGAIEFTKRYGDPHMRDYLNNLELDLIKTGTKDTEINSILNSFIDEKDKILGTFFTGDPASFTSRSVMLMKNMINLAYMGSSGVAAIPETARPLMAHGFDTVMDKGVGTRALFGVLNTYSRANLKDIERYAPFIELSSVSTNKFVADGGIALDSTRSGSVLDKYVGQYAERAQEIFFIVNGLQPITHWQKTFTSLLSLHRFIEDSIAWSKGKLDKKSQERMLSYGIDKETASVIARMPFDTITQGPNIKPVYLANVSKWDTVSGGTTARERFMNAVRQDTDRQIVTPTSADQPNMMSGVVRINSQLVNDLWENKLFREFMQFVSAGNIDKTQFGIKLNAVPIQLLTQFYSWAMGANTKVLLSMAQGREPLAHTITGLFALVGFGALSDMFKNIDYYENKPIAEKVVRAVELSGALALLGDVNYSLETISEGVFDTPLGIRPLIGAEPRFANPDEHDAIGEVIGAGPQALYDVIRIFADPDLSEEEKHNTIKRLLPLSNLHYIGDGIRNLYDLAFGIQE